MSTFVPDGNKPIKPVDGEKPTKSLPAHTPKNERGGLAPFPLWKRPNDEFVVDL